MLVTVLLIKYMDCFIVSKKVQPNYINKILYFPIQASNPLYTCTDIILFSYMTVQRLHLHKDKHRRKSLLYQGLISDKKFATPVIYICTAKIGM